MSSLTCDFCNKTFSRKNYYKKHLETCKSKLKHENIKSNNEVEFLKTENTNLKEQVKILTDELELLKNIIENQSKQPTKQINNNTQNNITINTSQSMKDILANLEPINFEEIKSSFENNFSEKYIDNGLEGLATFICEVPCQHKIITTDFSRKLVSYKTSPQQIVTDPNGTILLNTAIKQNAQTIIDKAEDRHKFWSEQVKEAIVDDIEPYERDVKNKKHAAKLIKVAANAKRNIPVNSKEACNVIILKGMENKNNVNAIE